MPSSPLGIEGFTEEDEAYHGSRFADVEAALFANPYQRTLGRPRRAGNAYLRSHAGGHAARITAVR